MPFLSPNQQCQSNEGKISHSMDLPQAHMGVFQHFLWPLIAPDYLGEGCHASHQPSDASTPARVDNKSQHVKRTMLYTTTSKAHRSMARLQQQCTEKQCSSGLHAYVQTLPHMLLKIRRWLPTLRAPSWSVEWRTAKWLRVDAALFKIQLQSIFIIQHKKKPYKETIHIEQTQENPRINWHDRQKITFHGSANPKISQQCTPATNIRLGKHIET